MKNCHSLCRVAAPNKLGSRQWVSILGLQQPLEVSYSFNEVMIHISKNYMWQRKLKKIVERGDEFHLVKPGN
jgi:hypothetical protein